jgi:predicted transcriptional regulator
MDMMSATKGKRQLTHTQAAIVNVLKSGSRTIDEIGAELGREYPTIYRPVKALLAMDVIEADPEKSAFSRAESYRIKRIPNDGVEFFVNIDGQERAVSFNSYLETIAKQKELPQIATAWRAVPEAFAMLAAFAAEEIENPGTITEGDLLDPLAKLSRYEEVLREQYSLVRQMREDLRLWNPATLKVATLLKTDRTLSPNEVRAYSRTIALKYDLMNEVNDNESEEENGDGE